MNFWNILIDSGMESFRFFKEKRKNVAWLFLLEFIFFVIFFTGSLYLLSTLFQDFDVLRNIGVDQNLLGSEEGLSELNDQISGLVGVADRIYGFAIGALIIGFGLK